MNDSIKAALTFRLENPKLFRSTPPAVCEVALAALAAGRPFTPVCPALGLTAGTDGARRGSDGVAYLSFGHGEWNDRAILALTEGEAASLGIRSLADQQAGVAAADLRAANRAKSEAAFLRDLDR